jgi:hypothetical protein
MAATASATVIGFEARRAQGAPWRDPTRLLDAVHSADFILLRADDRPAKAVAAILAGLGFLLVEEIAPDGAARRLHPGQFRSASPRCPWRVRPAD